MSRPRLPSTKKERTFEISHPTYITLMDELAPLMNNGDLTVCLERAIYGYTDHLRSIGLVPHKVEIIRPTKEEPKKDPEPKVEDQPLVPPGSIQVDDQDLMSLIGTDLEIDPD